MLIFFARIPDRCAVLPGTFGRRRPIDGQSRSAFTLVEVMIVLLIMSICAATATPTFFDSLLFHRVESAARRVKGDLELLRQTARLTSTEQVLTVLGMQYSTSAAVAALDHPGHSYSVDLSKAPYNLDVLAADFGGFTEVRFDGYGTPSSGGTIILQARNHQCTVTLNAATGQVTITSNHTGGRTARVVGN